ncbi:MAG: hypothetical protein HY258_12440 [Chloroflexi bacterium]|nr:hypothetical protein [Chloroflexota bacterium]
MLAYTGEDGKRTTLRVPNLKMLRIVLRDEALYEKYAKHLEQTHKGKFVAISLKGELVIADNMTDAFVDALAKFGPRKFALMGIGFDAVIRA